MEIFKNVKLRTSKNIITKKYLDDVLLFDNDTGSIYKFNSTAFLILDYLKELRTIDEVINLLKNQYIVKDEKDFENDILIFINKCIKINLIVIVG